MRTKMSSAHAPVHRPLSEYTEPDARIEMQCGEVGEVIFAKPWCA
jgi:hypothetical protein